MATASSSTSLETTVKEKLGIKWVCARDLVQQAKAQLLQDAAAAAAEDADYADDDDDDEKDDVAPDDDEILLQCLKLFMSLPDEKQAEMRLDENKNNNTGAGVAEAEEPAWQQKAREQAEKREREWEKQAAIEQAQEEAIARGEPIIKGPQKITKVTKTTEGDAVATEVLETIEHETLDGVHVKYTKVQCCAIL